VKPRLSLLLAGLLAVSFLLAPVQPAQATYRIAPGDRISVVVFGEPDMSSPDTRVLSAGTVSLPLLGEVKVVGLTTTELERILEDMLRRGYLKDPKVTVSIAEFRPVYVRGAVQKTGPYPYAEGMTVEKAVVQAGGVVEGATPDKITIVHEYDQTHTPQPATLTSAVSPGDIVTVEAVKSASVFFYVYGEVAKPGSFTYRAGLTVEKAIALAGGFGPRASQKKVNISRGGNPPEKLEHVELTEAIVPGDVVTVGASLF